MDLLHPIFRHGALVYEPLALTASRERTLAQLAALDESVQRLDDPAVYSVGLESRLYELKQGLIAQARRKRNQ